jgi:hypothetical protein
MNDERLGRRDEHLRHLYAKQKHPGESFEAFIARTKGDAAPDEDDEDDHADDEDGTHWG